jgi:integrase
MADTASTDLIATFESYMHARAFSPHTLERRRVSIGQFARFIHPLSLLDATGPDLEEWLGTKNAARTRHAYRSDLSAFYTWAIRRRLMALSPIADTDSIRVPASLPRPVPVHAVPSIVGAAPMPLRLGLAFAAYAGLRRAEIVALTSADVQTFGQAVVMVRLGKGAKDRIVPMVPHLVELLTGPRTDGRLVPLTARTLGAQAARHMRTLGYDCTLHQLRHSFGTEAARALHGNVVAVGGLMGHASPNTTQGYIGWAGGETADRLALLYVA